MEEKERILRRLWQAKMHVEARALELSPRNVRRRFEHIWQPAELLLQELQALPRGWLAFWQQSPRGHLVFTHRSSRYMPGKQPWREGELDSVCYVGLTDLVQAKELAMYALYHLFDHLLGSGAQEGKGWLSQGEGATEALRQVGQRFSEIYELGYGVEELSAQTPQDYFARTLWLYLQEPRRLSVLAPLVYKLYRHTLFQESFWRRM
ncbi:MAG: hypothetical protein J7M05_09415 [Anaerolineae bacterium]|nr:hypothetical protein [Anaerolineae bacterium]